MIESRTLFIAIGAMMLFFLFLFWFLNHANKEARRLGLDKDLDNPSKIIKDLLKVK